MRNHSFNSFGFLFVAQAALDLRVCDMEFNAARIRFARREAANRRSSIVLFPGLRLTGYSWGDLFGQCALIDKANGALRALAYVTKGFGMEAIVGVPLAVNGCLYNIAAFISGGVVVSIVPKPFLSSTGEFYEERLSKPGIAKIIDHSEGSL
jgi:NAD+ synthase (glutamine-hydrolysing)